jgi:hypothetical protein
MTKDTWDRAAAHFGITPDEADDYREAFTDVAWMGVDAYIDGLFAELQNAVAQQRVGQPLAPTAVRRLVARRTVALELVAVNQYDWLAQLDGPKH